MVSCWNNVFIPRYLILIQSERVMVNGEDDGQTLTQEEAEAAVEAGEADVIVRGPGGEVQETRGGDDDDGDGGVAPTGPGIGGSGGDGSGGDDADVAPGPPGVPGTTRAADDDDDTGVAPTGPGLPDIEEARERVEEGAAPGPPGVPGTTGESGDEAIPGDLAARQFQRQREQGPVTAQPVPDVPETRLPGEPGQDLTARQQRIREQAARIQRFQETGPGVTPGEEAVIQRGVIDLERMEARENLENIQRQREQLQEEEPDETFTVGGEELTRNQVLSRLESDEESLEEFLSETEELRRVEEVEAAEAERISAEQVTVGEREPGELSVRELEALGAEVFREEEQREQELREAGGFEPTGEQEPIIFRGFGSFEDIEQPTPEEFDAAFGGSQIGERTEEAAVARTLPFAAAAAGRDPVRFATRAASGLPEFVEGITQPQEIEQEVLGEVVSPGSVLSFALTPGVPVAAVESGPVPEALVQREADAPFTQQLDLREGDLPGTEQLPGRPAFEAEAQAEGVPLTQERDGLVMEAAGEEFVPEQAERARRERVGEVPTREMERADVVERELVERIPEEEVFTPEFEGVRGEELRGLSREEVEEATGFTPQELLVIGRPTRQAETEAPPFLPTGLVPPGVQEEIAARPSPQEDVVFEPLEEGEIPFVQERRETRAREEFEETIFREQEAPTTEIGVEALVTPAPDQEAAQAQPQVQLQEQEAALQQAFGQPGEPSPGVGQQPEFAPEQAPPELGFLSQQATRTRTRVGRGRDEDETELDRELESAFGLEVEEIPQASLTGAGREAPGDGVTPEVFTGAEIRFRGGEITSSEDLEDQLGI